MRLSVLVMLGWTSCAHAPRAAPACPAFTLPSGWQRVDGCEAASPEGALHARAFRATTTDDVAAITAAWASWRGGALTPVEPPTHPPARGGWTSLTVARLTTAGGATVRAEVKRAGPTSAVTLVEGDEAAHARRGAQVDALLDGAAATEVVAERFVGRAPRAVDARALAAFIDHARAQLGVPGVAVAIVSKRSVVFEHTSGVRRLGDDAPMGVHTRTLIGSVTKSMTTLLQASLVTDKTLTWETPVTRLLPGFAVGDAALTSKLELWHMSCACTGMPRRDLEHLFEFDGVTPERRLAELREMTPTTGLGEAFQYSNLMVAAGGFIAAHALAPNEPLGRAYQRALEARIFGPIKMEDARVDFAAATTGDVAAPHALDLNQELGPLPFGIEANVTSIAPAGAVWASLVDLERYAQTELNGGVTAEGTVVASNEAWARRLVPRAPGAAYGLGLDVDEVAGLRVIGHDGGSMGFGTSVYLLPDLGLGLIIATNARHGSGALQLPLNEAVKRRFLEALFDGATPRSEAIVRYALELRAAAIAGAAGVERQPDPAWVARLQGTWRHPTLGDVTIRETTLDAGEWQVRFGRLGEALVVLDPPFAGTALMVESDGEGPRLVVPDPQKPEVFRRLPR